MGKIRILNEEISSKIAAGEVIERPYSVIKEMVENSIDAGSSRITIEIEKGGKKLIRVLDDGEGMTAEDVKLCFERHATSKISKLDDIFSINTLGFRGEALASIASVSRVTMITKTQNGHVGTLCEIHGGNFIKFEEIAAQKGCLIEVKNLFYNTPARYKFLNSDSRETSLIVDFISKIAIGNPEISFKLISDGKEIIITSGNGNIREAIARIYGSDMAKKAIEIESQFSCGKVTGIISTPQYSRGNRNGEIFFVNHRLIRDKALSFCVERAYRTLIPIGRFPFCVIFIEIQASELDVNIHPSKTQIKFRNQNEIERTIYNAITNALKQTVLIPDEKLSTPVANTKQDAPFTWPAMTQKNRDISNINFLDVVYSGNNSEKINERMVKYGEVVAEMSPTSIEQADKSWEKDIPPYLKPNTSVKREKKLNVTKILGQIFNTYIIAEGELEIYIIDQHAAHERILFDTFNNRFSKRTTSQIIAPFMLQLTPKEMILVENLKEDIQKMGFDVSVFGKDTVLIRAVPCYFNKTVDPEALKNVIQELEDEGFPKSSDKEKLIASMACHTAIKANDKLNLKEMEDLISQLSITDNPYTCPHGRPTIISMTRYEFEKKFKRV